MFVVGSHNYLVENWDLPPISRAIKEVNSLPEAVWDRYQNPFERKWTLRNKFSLPDNLECLLSLLEKQTSYLSEQFKAVLTIDAMRHYAGVFRYGQGDNLGVHVDAGIQPGSGLRKHVTALLYLTSPVNSDLELWHGNSSCSEDPQVNRYAVTIAPRAGQVIYFENNDYAWHGVQPNYWGWPERVVLTVSYLSGEVDKWENKRQRAFFVPRPAETWTEETFRLRDLRSDSERYSEAYRLGNCR